MRRWLGWTWVLLLVCVAAVSMCGSRKPGYGSGYALTSAGYSRGGGSAGQDTLLSVYSTRTGMGDTLIANAAYDTFNTRWQAKKALADTVIRWGSDDPTFAYALIDTYYSAVGSWPTTASRATELRPKAMGFGTVTYPTPTTTRWALNDSTGGVHGRTLLVHFDPKIPENATVISAKLHFCALNWTSSATVDTLVAVLMTAPADSVWWRHKGINDNGSETAANMAKANYRYQWYATGSSPNYGYTNTGNGNTPTAGWTPALSTRARWWQWGDVADWTPAPALSAAGGDVAVDVTNCVQAIARGDENNGIAIFTGKWGTSDRLRRIINFDTKTTGGSAFYVPWLEVKYVTKRYQRPFPGGKDIAFVFQTDDGRRAYNDSLVAIFKSFGARYTIFLCDSLTVNGSTNSRWDHAIGWHDEGMELGWHSKRHRPGPGNEYLTVYEKSGITAAKMDSLRAEMNPETMYLRADALGRTDLRNSPYFGKSMALPGYPFSATVVNVAQEYGYNALRVGSLIPFTTANGANYVLASWRKAACDTARGHMPYGRERAPRNMMLLPLTCEINQIVGEKANTTITEDQVRFNLRRLFRQAKAQNRPAVSLYEHDFKSGSYSYGIDPEEMRWILKEAVAQNAWICTASEYAKWIKGGSVAMDTPTGYAQPDSFRFDSSDRVWFKPNGLDNRVVHNFVDIAAAMAADSTPPASPTLSVSYASNGLNWVSWTNNSSEPVTFNLYRFFDNASDTTLVAGAVSGLNAFDFGAVNGSPHNYFVRARDAAGNLSTSSSAVRLFPGYIRSIARPAYYALWFQDAPNIGSSGGQWTASTWETKLDSLSLFDAVVTGPFPLEISEEEAFNGDGGGATEGITAELRSRNADQTVLTYVHPWQMNDVWASLTDATSFGKRAATYLASVADSALYGKNLAGYVESRLEYSGTKFVNIMVPSTADTLAAYAVSAFDRSGADGEYCGLFLDDLVTTLADFMCAGGNCGDVMDFNQDVGDTPYNEDEEEQAAWEAWQVRFLKALRREFAERGMHNRLLAANSNFGRAATMSAAGDTIMKLLDGHMTESPFEWWPGAAAADTTWERAFAIRDRLTTAQISPALQMFQVKSDSSIIDQSEVLALAADAWVCANQNTPENAYGNNNVPPMVPADERLPYPGLFSSVTYADGGADPDTLKAKWSILTGRILLDHVYTSEADDDYGVMPYVVYTSTDTLSRSLYWERAGEEGAPAAPQYQTIAGDRSVTMLINTTTGDNKVWLPGDFLRFRIIRSHEVEVGSGLDTLYADPDTLAHYNSENPAADAFLFYDTGLTNGTEYCYSISSEDVLGNRSSEFAPSGQCRTPTDITAPAAPTALKAAGGAGYIDLDWLGVTAADLVGYEVSRAPETGDGPGTYAATDTVAISAHQDSTALESNFYYYRVRSLDDDGNRSAYTDAVTAAWYGDPDPPARPAPSNVMAWPDNPQGRTSVVMYAPADTTGLTGYQVFRGATADTGACVLYKTNVARGMFDGGVFEDLKANSDPDSTWYYTAKAMYGAARSEKFHTPRPALTTGNFPTLVPSVFAYGSGSSIGVAWVGITGADSTLIYRGTTAGSQSLLATVAHTANPYMDATAAANTDYYYRVRLKDNPSTYSDYSAVFGPVRWTSTPSGDPSISGVTNSSDVDHGETLTISGANFGTKATAAPQLYNDFDSYSEDQVATTAHGWSSVDAYGDGSGPWTLPVYSSDAGHVGKGLKGRFEGRTAISRVRVDRNWSGGVYLDYWYRHIEAEARSRNLKPWRFYGTGALELPQLNLFMQCADGSVQLPVSPSSAGPNYYMTSAENLVNQMRHWQFWLKPDVDGGTNGYMKVMLDGQVIEEHTGWGTNGPGLIGEYWAQLSISGYYSRSVEGGCPPAYITGNAYEYWDNLYIDNTQARVEIGNASTYATCTHREIQIPSAWAAGSITVTANTGSFADGSAYLFVIDSDGTASAGYPITVDAP